MEIRIESKKKNEIGIGDLVGFATPHGEDRCLVVKYYGEKGWLEATLISMGCYARVYSGSMEALNTNPGIRVIAKKDDLLLTTKGDM